MKKAVIGLIVLIGIGFLLVGQGKQFSLNNMLRKERVRDIKEKRIFSDRKVAPDFMLSALDGNILKLSDFKGKVVILDFWATWCPPCRAEIPDFVRLYARYKNSGLIIIGVSLDQDISEVKKFCEKMNVGYPIVMGNEKMMQDYGGINGIPTTFLIDRKGDIVKKYIGYTSPAVFEAEIKKIF